MNRQKYKGTCRFVVSLLAVAAFAASSAAAQGNASFTTPDGQSLSLASLRGKVTVLVFGGVNDPQCRDEFKALDALAQRFAGKNAAFYWVSIDPTSVTDAQVKAPCGPTYGVKILRDPSRAAFKQFGGRQLPTIVVLNPQGGVEGQVRGGFNPNTDFINHIADVIDGLLR